MVSLQGAPPRGVSLDQKPISSLRAAVGGLNSTVVLFRAMINNTRNRLYRRDRRGLALGESPATTRSMVGLLDLVLSRSLMTSRTLLDLCCIR